MTIINRANVQSLNLDQSLSSQIEIDTLNIESYGTVEEGDLYFSKRLRSRSWDNASTDDKNKALMMATNSIDVLNFLGQRTDPIQNLEFPRSPDLDVPNPIKFATFEIAIQLLSGVDLEKELKNLHVESRSYAQAKTVYDRHIIPEYLRAGIVSAIAWNYLRPYLSDPLAIKLTRVS